MQIVATRCCSTKKLNCWELLKLAKLQRDIY
nr:MAG TPA: hypothetical protein [Bacteriophage sp.]